MDVITYPCQDPDVGKVKGDPGGFFFFFFFGGGVITEVHYLENVKVLHNPLSHYIDVTLTHGYWNHKQLYGSFHSFFSKQQRRISTTRAIEKW